MQWYCIRKLLRLKYWKIFSSWYNKWIILSDAIRVAFHSLCTHLYICVMRITFKLQVEGCDTGALDNRILNTVQDCCYMFYTDGFNALCASAFKKSCFLFWSLSLYLKHLQMSGPPSHFSATYFLCSPHTVVTRSKSHFLNTNKKSCPSLSTKYATPGTENEHFS